MNVTGVVLSKDELMAGNAKAHHSAQGQDEEAAIQLENRHGFNFFGEICSDKWHVSHGLCPCGITSRFTTFADASQDHPNIFQIAHYCGVHESGVAGSSTSNSASTKSVFAEQAEECAQMLLARVPSSFSTITLFHL